MTSFYMKAGDRARVKTPTEPEFHGRVVRLVGRAPTQDHWKCIFLDDRPHPNLEYDFCFRDDELDLLVDRKRRPPRKDEITNFARWLTEQGFTLYEPDPAALFYVGRQPLREVPGELADLTDRYLREQGLD